MRRDRTQTDDVIEAMQRGVDIAVIRELGVIYDDLRGCLLDDHAGYWDSDHVREIAIKLNIDDPRQDVSRDYTFIDMCFSEIRFRLTGHRNEEIEVT